MQLIWFKLDTITFSTVQIGMLDTIGFVPGRAIHENIIIAKEVMHMMNKKKGKKGFFAIKVDLSKA